MVIHGIFFNVQKKVACLKKQHAHLNIHPSIHLSSVQLSRLGDVMTSDVKGPLSGDDDDDDNKQQHVSYEATKSQLLSLVLFLSAHL